MEKMIYYESKINYKIKRQGLNVSIRELNKLIKEFEVEDFFNEDTKILIPIINKTPQCSDTWELEE